MLKDIRELTREEIFEIYIAPAKDTDEDGNEIGQHSSMTHREQSFVSLQGSGKNWLESERAYQEWLSQKRK